jgi:phage FluMu protein Com
MIRLRCAGCGKFISQDQIYAYIDGEFYCFRLECKGMVEEAREAELIMWAEKVLDKSLSGGSNEKEFLKKHK